MVVEHLGPNETLLGVISIAILFGIRKYLMTDNDDMNSHKNKDAENALKFTVIFSHVLHKTLPVNIIEHEVNRNTLRWMTACGLT